MKNKSALKRSVQSVKFLAVALLIGGVLAIRWPNVFTYIILGVTLLGFVGDIVNVIYIRRRARHDPSFLEQNIR